MQIEGHGYLAPTPKPFQLERGDLIVLATEAAKRSSYRKYGKSGDRWKSGLSSSVRVDGYGELASDASGIYVGLAGEYAVEQFIRQRRPAWTLDHDMELRREGDGGIDIIACGLKVQVKTKRRPDGDNLIRKCPEYRWQVAVFCMWNCDGPVLMLGWAWRSAIINRDPEQSRFGSWLNYAIDEFELQPMGLLIDEMEAAKGVTTCP